VPLYASPDELPSDIDIACVVIGTAMTGGPGLDIALALMARGIHVLQEHPLHHDELVRCLREAHRHGVVYHLNTHYVHVEPVRRFVATASALIRHQRPLFVDAAGAFQVAFTLFDIVGQALGGLRPWSLTRPPPAPAGYHLPFRSLDGVIAGVPCTVRIQNELDPRAPDNFAHFSHRVSIGTEGGNLMLANTHGPLLWFPRPHMPADLADAAMFVDSAARHLGLPSASVIGPPAAPSYREVLGSLWPDGVRRALAELRQAITDGGSARGRAQYHLALCRLTQDVATRLGPVTLRHQDDPHVLSADALATEASGLAASSAGDGQDGHAA
jgi:thiazolinyl imide reductase